MATTRGLIVLIGIALVFGACTETSDTTTPSTPSEELSPTTSPPIQTTSTIAASGLDLSDAAWVTHGPDGIRLDDGTLIRETRPFPTGLARDRAGGLVYSDSTGLWWLRGGAREPVSIAEGGAHELVAVVAGPDEPLVRTMDEPAFYSIFGGEPTDFPPTLGALLPHVSALPEAPWRWEWTAVNLLSASVAVPEVELNEESQVSNVIAPARLVVSTGGQTLVEVRIGSDDEPWVNLHDFDGQRVILSRGPFEPAMPEETFLLVDLSTGTMTEIFVAAGTRAAFTGADSDWAGPVATDFGT